jgi:hypothetical protein
LGWLWPCPQIKTQPERVSKDKPSSYLGLVVSDEEKNSFTTLTPVHVATGEPGQNALPETAAADAGTHRNAARPGLSRRNEDRQLQLQPRPLLVLWNPDGRKSYLHMRSLSAQFRCSVRLRLQDRLISFEQLFLDL